MESSDRDLILRFLKNDAQLRRLYNEHVLLEGKLERLKGRTFLTSQEEIEAKQLKKRKLQGVDKMMDRISNFRLLRSVSQKAA